MLYDTTSPVVSISPTSATIAGSSKKNQTLTFTVSISGSSPNPVTVRVGTTDGTAKAGTDYTAVSSTLTFAAGNVTAQTVIVTILLHKTGTLNKTFTLSLTNPTGATISSTASKSTITITGTSAQVAATIAPAGSALTPLTTAELQPVITAAERAWEAAGVSPARFAHVRFVITTRLPVGEIGYTDGHTIYIDATAAGFGWYTGRGGTAFEASGIALAGGPAAGRMDLLTVVMHELGHTVGLPDGCACGAATKLMHATLAAGVRRSLGHGAVPSLKLRPANGTAGVATSNAGSHGRRHSHPRRPGLRPRRRRG
jgi:hypothetical protein